MATARECLRHGGVVAIEWPNSCLYWQWPQVRKFLQEEGFSHRRIDGCALGLASRRTGLPILKPWKIASNSERFLQGFDGYRCDGSHHHTPCEGSDTKLTEGYTPLMAQVIHHA